MTREEIEKLPVIVAMMLSESVTADVNEKIHEKITEVCNLAIKALEQEPRKGHWIPIYQGDEIIDYRCSECEFGNTFGKGTFGMNFCPNCGADMRGEKE